MGDRDGVGAVRAGRGRCVFAAFGFFGFDFGCRRFFCVFLQFFFGFFGFAVARVGEHGCASAAVPGRAEGALLPGGRGGRSRCGAQHHAKTEKRDEQAAHLQSRSRFALTGFARTSHRDHDEHRWVVAYMRSQSTRTGACLRNLADL
jgi:hypothetical protein